MDPTPSAAGAVAVNPATHPYQLRCRLCGAGFFGMLELLKHRDRCQGDAPVRPQSHTTDAGQPDLATEPSAFSPAGKGAR